MVRDVEKGGRLGVWAWSPKVVVMERMAVSMICSRCLLERWAVMVAALVYRVVVEAVDMKPLANMHSLMPFFVHSFMVQYSVVLCVEALSSSFFADRIDVKMLCQWVRSSFFFDHLGAVWDESFMHGFE